MIALWLTAFAAPTLDELRQAELDRTRRAVADQVQLSAYDLVDELVIRWAQDPVFDRPTDVVLAGVTVPVGLGTGLQTLIENHLADVIGKNSAVNVRLVHCPSCTAVVVRSGPEGTIVSRGVDDPSTLEALGHASGKHALFVDLEAEGSWLVLRARLTRLTPDLPIVWSRAISTSASTPALLREATSLKTASDARAEYLDALRDRGPLTIPLRLVVRSYARADPDDGGVPGLPPPPILWLQTGVEMAANEGRAWTASVVVGYSFIPQAYQGIMAQSRVNRLLTGRVRSHTRPDVYAFAGAAVMSLWGDGVVAFGADRVILGGLQTGLDLRFGNRVGVSGFFETLPALNQSPNVGRYVRVLGIPFQSFGAEVAFCF